MQYVFLEFCFTYYTVYYTITCIYVCIFFLFKHKLHFCDFLFYNDNDFIRISSNFIKNNVISAKFQHSKSKL